MTPPPLGWVTLLLSQAPHLAPILRAFGPPECPSACSPAALRDWAATWDGALRPAIEQTLGGEVDADQAAMFARRLGSVRSLLRRIDHPVLDTALVARAVELLVGPAPRALRIRALADFYYSQAARLHHQSTTPARALDALVADAVWHAVGPGLHHTKLTGPGPAGPVHINVLRGDRIAIRCVHLAGNTAPLHEIAREQGAAAAVSGGFFLYSEPDIPPPLARRDPVGLLIQDGRVRSGPTLRRATIWQDASGIHIDRVGPEGWTVSVADTPVEIAACNRSASGPSWFNRACGHHAPEPGLQVRGNTARGRGRTIDLLGGVLAHTACDRFEGPVQWHTPAGWSQAMAGGPMLLGPGPTLDLAHEDFAHDAPPITFSRDETYDENLLPRMAAGLDHTGRLFLAAIDGRNFDRAPGFTLRMTADLMRALGCVHAMNLDGGSSKRMAIGDRCVDLATTEVVAAGAAPSKTRAVISAILLYCDEDGTPR